MCKFPSHILLFYAQPNHNISLDPNKLIEVTANPLITTEFPMLMILDTVEKLDPSQLDNNFVVFSYNCGNNDLVLSLHTTVAELVCSNLHIKVKSLLRHKCIFGSKINIPWIVKKNQFFQLKKQRKTF